MQAQIEVGKSVIDRRQLDGATRGGVGMVGDDEFGVGGIIDHHQRHAPQRSPQTDRRPALQKQAAAGIAQQ